MRNLNHNRRPKGANIVRSAAFAAALLGSTIMGCGTAQRPGPKMAPQAETQQPVERKIDLKDVLASGNGSKTKPYVIDIMEYKRGFDVGSIAIEAPLAFAIENQRIHFRVKLNVSQLRADKINYTGAWLRNIMRAAATEYYYEKKIKMGGKIEANIANVVKGLRDMAAKAAQADADVRDYLTQESEPIDEKITMTYLVFVIQGKKIPCRNMLVTREHELKEGDSIEDVGRIEKVDDEGITLNLEMTGRDIMLEYGETLKVDREGLNYLEIRPERNERDGIVTIYVENSSTLCAAPPPCKPDKKKFQNTQI